MTEKKAKPQIRFAGFSDTWEQRKVSDEMSDFIVPMRDKPKEFGGNIPWTRIEDIEGKYLNDSLSGQYVTEETVQKMNLKIIPKDSLIVSSSATFGTVAVVTTDLITNQTFIGLVPKEKDAIDYWYTYFQSHEAKKYMKLQSAGSTIFYIARESFECMPILIPSKNEMRKIGNFFTSLDNLITLHQRKLDKLTNVKKSMLEKMFPKNGANVPEIRFKGFTAPWEQRKLGMCFSERIENMPNGELISVTINDGIKKFSELGRHDNSNDDKSKYKKVCIGDIAYNSMRMWQGASGYSSYEGIVSPAYTVLSPNEDIYSKCIAYQFKLPQMIHTFQINSQGITSDNWNLKYPTLSKIDIYISESIQEQKKIAEFFTHLDHLITLHQRRLEKLKNIKKACLEKMFI